MEAWEKYAADFNALTDEQIKAECDDERSKMEQAEEWLEAVATWEAAGKPRTTPERKQKP